MPECDDCDNEEVVVNQVDDPVVPNANSQTGTSLEGFGAWWPWILTEERDRSANAVAILMINLLQRANFGRTQLDLVGHTQPRSAFT